MPLRLSLAVRPGTIAAVERRHTGCATGLKELVQSLDRVEQVGIHRAINHELTDDSLRLRAEVDQPFTTMMASLVPVKTGDPNGPGGVLHAKAVVADDEAVFVTSANLTEAALDRNIEVGLLIRDRALAATVSSHFQGLIDRELLRPLPMT